MIRLGLALLVLVGCGGQRPGSAPARGGLALDPKPEEVRTPPVCYMVRKEVTCFVATSSRGTETWTELAWGDRFYTDPYGRTVISYRGWVVWTCPFPRRARRAL